MRTFDRLLILLAVAAVALAGCAQPGTDDPAASGATSVPEATGSPQPSAEPSETSAPPPWASETPSTWTVADTFEEPGTAAFPHDVLTWGDGFVAIGERATTEYLDAPGRPRLWIWADGSEWDELAPELGHADAAVVGGSVLEDGRLLLFGYTGDVAAGEPQRPRMWTSQDAERWEEQEVPFPQSARSIGYAAGPIGHVAVIEDRIWFSESGSDWREVYDVEGDGLSQAAAGDEGFVVGRLPTTGDVATLLASGDGVEWFESEPNDVIGPSPFGVDWLGYAYTEDPPTIMLARSANGLDWETYRDVNELTPPDGPKAGQGLESEIQLVDFASADGLVVMTLGWNHCCAQLPQGVMVLTSPDANDWTEIDLGQDAFVTSAAANDERIVLGGYVNRGQAVTFWVIQR